MEKQSSRTKEQLIEENMRLRTEIEKLRKSESKGRKTEESLRESEEKYKALYDNAPLSYQSLNEDGSFKDVNPTWLTTLGYEREEVIGKFYKDFLHPDWKPHFEKNFPAFKKRGYVHDVEFKIRHKKGHYLDISFEGCVGYNPDGSFKQTYCVFKEITEQKKAEKDLRQTNILLESSIESPKGMIILSLDREYRYLFFNKTHEASMRVSYGTNPLIGECIFDYMTNEDDINKVKAHYDRALTGESHIVTEEYGAGDVRSFYQIRFNPIYNEDKEIIGITSFAENVTDHMLTKEKLASLNSLLFSIIDSPENIIMFALDTNYNYLNFNKAHIKEMKLIYDVDIKVGQHILDLMPNEEDVQKAVINYKRVLKGERFVEIQQYGLGEDRSWYELIFNPITDSDKGITGFTVYVTNITDRKKAEEELLRYRGQLELIVAERTKELVDQNKKLDDAMKVFVGREQKINELEKRIRKMGGKMS